MAFQGRPVMGQSNWLAKLSIETPDGQTIVKYEQDTDLMIAFQVETHTLQAPDICHIVIHNVGAATALKFTAEFKEIVLKAGYVYGGFGEIFRGSIVETQYGRKVDNFTGILLEVWCANSDIAYSQSKVNTTLAAGYTPQNVVDTCLKAMQSAQPGFSMGQVVGVDLSQPRFSRGTTLTGLARDYLRELCLTKGANFTLSGNALSIYAKDANPPAGGEVVLRADTGMVSQPILTPQGVVVQCLINNKIVVNSVVKIDSAVVAPQINDSAIVKGINLVDQKSQLMRQISPDQRYRVLHIVIDGQTRGQDWTMTLTTIAVGASPNTVQAGLFVS